MSVQCTCVLCCPDPYTNYYCFQAQKAEVAAELDRTCKELEGARKELGAREAQAKKLGAQLLRDAGELARTKSDLAREQALVRLLRSKGSKVGGC